MISYEPLFNTIKSRGLTFSQFQEDMGMKGGYLINVINRGGNINTDTLERICVHLNCGIDDVVCWKEGEQQPVFTFVTFNCDKLKEAFKDRSMRNISIELGLSPNYINSSLAAHRKMKLSTLEKICETIGIPLEEVYEVQ